MAIKSAAPVSEKVDTEVPRGIPRDRYGRPLIDGKPYRRASTFGEALEDTFGVNMWGRNMVAYEMGRREDLRLRAAGIPAACGAVKGEHRCHPPRVEPDEGKRELES